MILQIISFFLLIRFKSIFSSEFPVLDENFEKIGRIEKLDVLINEDFVLKAIAFSSTDKTNVYKEILYETLKEIDSLIKNNEILEIQLSEAKYYKYIVENVIKFTSKWLTEEVHQLTIETQEKKTNLQLRKKRNIAEFIYFTAGEYGVNLVMENKDTSFNSWSLKHKNEL